MMYLNRTCADAGTAVCPCPLAETGDCLVCSRLAGGEECGCSWAGVCIYNEYIQNDKTVRDRRQDIQVRILKRKRCPGDVVLLQLEVPKGMALRAGEPGSFVFLRCCGSEAFSGIPVSVMSADGQRGIITLVFRILSYKTKKIAEAKDKIMVRGVYRNGLLGGGTERLSDDVKSGSGKWLVMTRGMGFAPAVNLLKWAGEKVRIYMVNDTENAGEKLVKDCFGDCMKAVEKSRNGSLEKILNEGEQALKSMGFGDMYDYDRVVITASDYYISKLTEILEIPEDKLVISNNYHMCCGEGICGACGHVDERGNVNKMCKCRCNSLAVKI